MPVSAPHLASEFINRVALADGELLGVAVSGGGDSMGLLHLLLQENVRVTVATVNHHLRDEAAAEAREVATYCADHNVAHEVLDWHWDGQGNLSDQARRGRYQLLADWAGRTGVCDVALGHTQDDNIETFLMGLSRGAGLDGLSGMRHEFVQSNVTFHRPLLNARRADLREMLRAASVKWCDDPSNDDPNYHRIQIRQNLDALAAVGINAQMLAKSVRNLHASRWDANANLAQALEGHFRLDHGDLCFDLDWLENTSQETRRRVLNAGLRFVSGRDYPPRAEKIARLLAELRRKSVLHGCVIEGADSELRICREYGAVAALSCKSQSCWDQRWYFDGQHTKTSELRVLGEDGIAQCPNGWRALGLPRMSVLASPSVWEGCQLLSAPLAGWPNKWALRLRQSENDFISSILSH